MKDNVVYFVLGTLAGQLIKDNLPNLHWRNLLRYLGKLLKPLEPFAIFLLGILAIKLAKTQEQKIMLSLVLITTIALSELSKREGKKRNLIKA